MGIPMDMRDAWVNNRRKSSSFMIASPEEDLKFLRSQMCTQEGVREGMKAASVACVASAVPTLVAVRTIPWAKANLNYTAQALIISAASIAAYFVTADKTILECARKNTRLLYDKTA
ncbi:early nodulin-93-like [Cynara cardunculus var. scolymus]|uniref:Early nodulin 93 ENOD93 protein n=1 Tax=Cynara cardunculus var. scolymus TaxID=59895 RepID=A0A103XFQ5_CYNCS|nr:early nodulin-93-like [Cynara cardunculus var. scolymus]XP_024985923.1 early nodulin-93-like [Cynara cardunculus var. scolymus]XP_024985924.1 early nodulin-93-like [Cynara cardunculus var. scolymus]KVH89929.1 Early nodulin 93 ENOD93 protein [Cynara cardunculus var. scolymus]